MDLPSQLPAQMEPRPLVPPPQLPLPGFGLTPSLPPRCPPAEHVLAPAAVWNGLSARQRAHIRQTARRICQALLHDAQRQR
jgi:hypothetical protein